MFRVPIPTAIPLLIVMLLPLGGCAQVMPPAVGEAAPGEARVFFASPADGATVTSPVAVTMAAENFVVEPASDTVLDGHGHLHIMVDTPCVAPGQGIPKDDAHLHFGQGQLEAELELAPGEHSLCLQAADGLHVGLDGDGMTDVISLVVE